jgi:phosphomannomutase
MSLIKSISGIRGTVGGQAGEGFDPIVVLKFSLAFGRYLLKNNQKVKVVVGRDARPSGKIFVDLIKVGLSSLGVEAVDGGLISMPTLEMAVLKTKAAGGILVSASHNPNGWNALKFLDEQGEIFTKEKGEEVLRLADDADFTFTAEESLGGISEDNSFLAYHLEKILALDLVNKKAIAAADFKIAVDGINSVGGRDVPELLQALGVNKIEVINGDRSGKFAHNPEPLDKNLSGLVELVKAKGCDVGLVVDPDGDRLSIVCEDGSFFNEEYVIVAAADYVLGKTGQGNTVSNLSSTRALKDVTEKYGGKYSASAVGETNVVVKMKAAGAVIGGEGNGGVIYPELHYGRDALVGIALFLSYLAESKGKCSELKKKMPAYFISKNKLEFKPGTDLDGVFARLEEKYREEKITKIDGLKIDFAQGWVHLRRSNTEPIMRIYAESDTLAKADALAQEIIELIKETLS